MKKRFFIVMTLIACAALAHATLFKSPWTMSPTTHSVRVLWQTTDADATGVVHYGLSADALTSEITSTDGWYIEGEGFVHIVQLTDLQPFTRYYFRVGDATQTYDPVCSTKTAPNAGTAYRIFTLSDIHENSCRNWLNMQQNICALAPDIAIFNGDFVNEGNLRKWNTSFFTPGAPFLAETPIMSSPGNHETGDPTSYRYSTFYDYFSQFSHGASEDPVKDPRGESYFTFPYGNAQVIVVNINGDASSPDFLPGSAQYQWLDQTIAATTSPWIFIFGHVGIYTSGYHGQWSAEPKQLAPMLERYAAQGKHIIYFCGDDHSFEHLYKDGVHYVRPGCGRNSNYAQQTGLKDAQYSMFYRQISCYSTLDMAADASTVHLTARDSASNIFYEYTFHLSGDAIAPAITFTAPNCEQEAVDSVMLQWFSFDPAKDAEIAFYYTTTPQTTGGTLIADQISALPKASKQLWWHTRDISPKGSYYVYATITSSAGNSSTLLPYPIVLKEDTIAPPAPADLTGDIRDGHYFLAWQNPTHPVHIDNLLQDFSSSTDGFIADGDGGTATLSLEDGALRVDYTVNKAWGEGAANYVYAAPTDVSATPTLSFRLRGDGSGRALRLVVKNICNGHEDWWYTEKIKLSSASWKDYQVDLRSLSSFSWYENSGEKNDLTAVQAICFIVPSDAAATGTILLDDIRLSGEVLPCSDFAGTIIVRRTDHFATSSTDGDVVYDGTAETCVDATAETCVSPLYYYAAFSYDDRGNISSPAATAQWLSSDLNPSAALPSLHPDTDAPVKLLPAYGICIRRAGHLYTLSGIRIL